MPAKAPMRSPPSPGAALSQWMTIERAAELTGLPDSFLHERTGAVGVWPEGTVWKWFEGRKLIDYHALHRLIDATPSVPSNRGRRRTPKDDACPEGQAKALA